MHAHGTPVVIYREGARAGDAATFGELLPTASVLRWWLLGRVFCAYRGVRLPPAMRLREPWSVLP